MQNIHKFNDYRSWLRSLYESHKLANKSLTLVKFAEGLGLNASTLKMILTGKRKLALSKVPALAKKFALSSDEVEFLETLILNDKIKSDDAKTYFSKKVRSAKNKLKLNTRIISHKGLLSDPLALPVLVFLTDALPKNETCLYPNDEELQNIVADKFKLPKVRVESIFEKIQSNGVWPYSHENESVHYSYSKMHNSIQQKEYLKDWIRNSEKLVDPLFSDPETLFNSSTISMTPDQISSFKQELKVLIEKYMTTDTDKAPENQTPLKIVQANFQIYPLT